MTPAMLLPLVSELDTALRGGHQPREQWAGCRYCQRPTWKVNAICEGCVSVHGDYCCERCDEGTK